MDVFNFPNTQNNNYIFFANGGTTSWQTWSKPRNIKFVSIFAISGGGGGGAGFTSALGANGGGGGGGASSGVATGIFPANSLPDTLYIQVGLGGGGAVNPGTGGSNGGVSYVSAQPNTTSINVIIAGTTGTVGAGGGGTGAAGGAGGGTPTAFNKTLTGLLGACGTITSVIGFNGVAGGFAASGLSVSISGVTTGGAGGGGKSSANVTNVGGNITGIGIIPTINGGSSTGGNGETGFRSTPTTGGSSYRIPMFFTGGSGAGSSITGAGGIGGIGGYGSGGGGGGAGITGGRGGNGGDGLVVITCW